MSVVTKKVGNKTYAYIAVRRDKKVIHTYLGPVNAPDVKKRIAAHAEARAVPDRFRALFWDTKLEDIYLRRNARYIIERVLEMGSLDAFNWLQRAYSGQEILDVLFTTKALSGKSKAFWELWLGLSDT